MLTLGLGLDDALGLPGEVGSVTPAVPGPAVWHRADIGVTGTTTVDAWADISGNGRHATGSGGTRPALVTTDTSYAGHPTINFASSKVLANASWGATITGSVTVFFVGNCGATDAYHCAIDGAPINEVTDVELVALANPSNAGTNLADVAAEFPFGGLSPAAQLSSPCVYVATFNASTFTSAMYVNSVTPVKTTVGADPSPLVLKTKAHTLGALSDAVYWGMSAYWDGKLAEVGIYAGVLTAAQISNIVYAASARYGLTVQYLGLNASSVGGISPVNGDDLGGTTVTLKGWGFAQGTPTVTFGGTAATSVVVSDDNTLTCVTPAKTASTVDVVVTINGHSATLSSAYEFLVTAYTQSFNTWYRSDRNVTTVSGKVQKWADSSPVTDTGKDLTDAGSSAKRPTYSASDAAFNNKPSLNYDTAAKQLISGTIASPLTTPQTIFVVGKTTGNNADAGYYISGNLGAPRIYKLAADTTMYALDTSAANLGAHTTFIAILVCNGASSFHMRNTTTATTVNLGAGHTITTIWTGINTAGTATGKIVECGIKAGAASVADCQALMLALGKRYGITIS